MHGSEVSILNDDEDEDAACTKGDFFTLRRILIML